MRNETQSKSELRQPQLFITPGRSSVLTTRSSTSRMRSPGDIRVSDALESQGYPWFSITRARDSARGLLPWADAVDRLVSYAWRDEIGAMT